MEYVKKDLGSYNLHLIKTDKFKTITVRVVFHTPIIKEDITKRNILADILFQSSKKYKNRREITIKSEDLYSADIYLNNYRLGNYIFTNFNLSILQDKYTEENNLEKSFEFFSDLLFDPDVTNKTFNEEKLDIVKENTRITLNSIKESSGSYSLMRLFEAYDSSSPVSYRMIGYSEDLEKIDTKNLYEYYEKMINEDYVDVVVLGDFDIKEMTLLIKKYFKFRKVKKQKDNYILKLKKPRARRLIAKEKIENNQSKLAIACPIPNLNAYEREYPLSLCSFILGGGTDSKLFKEVREKYSLCYSINSILRRQDNMMIITAGIDRANYKKTLDLIKKNIQKMKKGKFTEKEINTAKEFFNTSMDEIYESENRIINEMLITDIFKLDSFEERIKKMNKVTKQEIIKVSKKLSIDTIFLLEGVKNDYD